MKSNKFVLPLSKDIIEYFVNEYEIKNIKDIKDTNISFEIESHNKIKIGNSFVSPIYSKDEFINIYSGKPKEEYNSEKITSFRDNLLSKKENYIYKYNVCGEATIKELENKQKDNKYVTKLITESDTGYETIFHLKYPLLYDENHKIIKFINEKGNGSVNGLEGEQIYIDYASEYDDENIISQNNDMAIINPSNIKNDNSSELHNVIDNVVIFIFIYLLFGLIALILLI